MKHNNAFIAIGLMLFALFFGAGNIIFPPFLGQHAGLDIVPAITGFLITGCGLPLLGVVTVCWAGKNLQDIAGRVYPWYGVFMVAAISLTIGPFFAIPRTCSTSFEMSVAPFIGAGNQTALFAYSVVFFVLTWWLAVTPTKLVDRVGKILTPIMLILLFALFAAYTLNPFGEWQAPTDPASRIRCPPSRRASWKGTTPWTVWQASSSASSSLKRCASPAYRSLTPSRGTP